MQRGRGVPRAGKIRFERAATLRYKLAMIVQPLALGIAMTMLAAGAPAAPQHDGWQVHHQSDRFVDRVLMEATAKADSSPVQLSLYCDTDNGFRILLMPHQALMPEGPTQLSFRIDDNAPVTASGTAFGDDSTDVVTVYDTARLEAALAAAKHVAIRYTSGGTSGDLHFTFAGLAADKPMVMKVCPLR